MNIKFNFLFPVATRSSSFAVSADIASATQGYAKASVEASKIIESALATDTASGDIASFSDGADGLNVKSLVLGIEPTQSGSGDPSPSNVRPISGHTDVVVTRCGKNMLPSLADTKTVNGITFTHNADGTYKVNGTASANTTFYFTNQNAQAVNYPLKSAAYKVSGCPSGGSSSTYRMITYLYKGDTYTGTAVSDTGSGGNISAADFDGARTAIDIKSGTTVSNLVFSPMIRISTDDATYEPYQSDTLSIPLPTAAGTVYGGTLDVTSGKLKLERALFDLTGTTNWSKSSSYPGGFYRSGGQFRYQGIEIKTMTPIICSHAKTATSIGGYVSWTCYMDNSVNIRIMSGSDTVQDWTDYLAAQSLAGTPVQICATLKTPIEYTLTPAQLATLKGSNNIWQDSGTISVEYFCDTKLYINKVLAALA